jgi:hypothetical protein
MDTCSALLECGYPCGEMFESKTHGFRLCARHLSQAPSYFLNLPVEIRFEIYDYLLPNKTVSATCNEWERGLFRLRHHNEPVAVQLLLVNKKIHDEVIAQLYSHATFEICVANFVRERLPRRALKRCGHIQICRASPVENVDVNYPPVFESRHALQDYQIQLMLLEQQNKKRLMAPLYNPYSTSASFDRGNTKPVDCIIKPWTPRNVVLKNLLRMRDFEINIEFQIPPYFQAGHTDYVDMHEFCDLLNTLSDRLATFASSIRRIKVSITLIILFPSKVLGQVDVSILSRMFLQPFGRLRGIGTAHVTSIVTKFLFPPENSRVSSTSRDASARDPIVQKFYPHVYISSADFQDWMFIKTWETDITQSGPPIIPEVYSKYMKLASMVSKMSLHGGWMPAEREGLMNTMHRARIARENEDLKELQAQHRVVLELLASHRKQQEDFNAYTTVFMHELMPA